MGDNIDKRIGNEFWKLRSTHGRDKLFASPELLWEAACEYFQWCVDNPLMEAEQAKSPGKPVKDEDGKLVFPPNLIEIPKMRPFTIQGLCRYLCCNTKYFNDLRDALREKDDEISKGFSEIVARILDVIYEQKFTGAASGFLNPNIIARDLSLTDKTELVGKDNSDLFKEKSDDELKALLLEISAKLND